jgi:hypothetical protein
MLRPCKARLAWIEHTNLRPACTDDRRYPQLEAFHGQAHVAARFTWGDYVALSYCWGSNEGPIAPHIVLNGCWFPVTENLEAALHAIRVSNSVAPIAPWRTKIWVDAICINQADIPEKEIQVHRMKDIYGQSIGVFVHLGMEQDDTNRGIDVLQRIVTDMAHGVDRSLDLLQAREQPTEVDRQDYTALMRLLTRPYWNRLWILQELAMGRFGLAIGYGNRRLQFQELVSAAKFIWHNMESFLLVIRTNASEPTARVGTNAEADIAAEMSTHLDALNRSVWVILFVYQLWELGQRLENSQAITYADLQLPLFNLCQNAQATVPHDKIYGLLSIMPEAIKMDMKQYTDYTLPIEAVFVAFSKAVINYTGRLDIIYSRSLRQELAPSWVTDWRLLPHRVSLLHDWHTYGYNEFESAYRNLRQMVETSRQAQADGGRNYPFQFLADSSVLACSGIMIGTVDGLAAPMPDMGGKEFPHSEHIQPQNQRSPYGDEKATIRALVHTMFANPVWGDLDEASFFRIPWLRGELYESCANCDIVLDDAWKANISEMIQHDWSFLFTYGSYMHFELFRCHLGRFLIGGKRFQDYFVQNISELSMPPDRIRLDLAKVSGGHLGRRLITLHTGHFGLGPNTVLPNDAVYVILGCSLPVVLRRAANTPHFRVIGECYVEGFANGEAVLGYEEGQHEVHKLTLC